MAKPKKDRVSLLDEFNQQKSLPTPDQVLQTVAAVTGQTPVMPAASEKKVATDKLSEEPRPYKKEKPAGSAKAEKKLAGRPPKNAGRVKYTTMLKPKAIRKLQIIAAAEGKSPADILEEFIMQKSYKVEI